MIPRQNSSFSSSFEVPNMPKSSSTASPPPSATALKRRNTTPVAITPVSVGRNIARQTQHRLTMKSNPYIGWFRHSPPTARLSENWKWKQLQQQQRQQYQTSCQQKNKMLWYNMPSALPSCKNSPHIGWFRHAPPSRLDCHVIQKPLFSFASAAATSTATTMTPEEEQLILKLVEELTQHRSRKSSSCDGTAAGQQPWIVSGRLPGGGKEYLEGTKSRRHSVGSSRYVQELLQESSREGTLNTANALSRLASWFLFPVAYDAESCGYHQHERDYTTTTVAPPKRRSSRSRKREAGLLRHLSPYLSTFLEDETPRQEKYARYATTTAEDHRDDGNDNDDESDGSDSDSVASSLANSPPVPQTLHSSRDLSLSVSSLAEAYYAHQATTKDMVVAPSPETPRATVPVASGYEGSPLNPHRLDYDITQMDIARMTRNAARHLDVQSILSLPVITYQKGVTIKPLKKQQQQQQQEEWSWTMVEEDVSIPALGEEIIPEAGAIKEGEVDFCVICLEHFANGDRLRVLPCDHSFHVGCIDRWLSGSQSFEECYTSGCPTCKKRPIIDRSRSLQACIDEDNPRADVYRSGSLDGSVPSWAFAQIGSALLAQQDQAI